MERKKCIECGAWKPLSEFRPREEGGKVRGECKDCRNAYNRERYRIKVGKFKREIREDNREADPKKCIRCGELKPLASFGWHNQKKGQHRNFCKLCHKEWDRQYKHSPEGKKLIDEWKEKNQEKIVAYRELYNKDPRYKEKSKQYSRKALLSGFGITQEDYDRMLEAQNGQCKICGSDKPDASGRKKNFHVDHDHVTGKVRGLLCHNCNVGLGNFRDSSELMKKAASYLNSFNH